jgi:quercetin dioxygenase-like cupin family protein
MQVIHDRSRPSSLADPAHFTGRVWRTGYIDAVADDRISGIRFLYEPGARSFWHVHDREQAIVAVYGAGLVAWDGLSVPVALDVGDWWHVEPGIAHWHGATAHASFAHLAVTAGGSTRWLHEVSERDYAGG